MEAGFTSTIKPVRHYHLIDSPKRRRDFNLFDTIHLPLTDRTRLLQKNRRFGSHAASPNAPRYARAALEQRWENTEINWGGETGHRSDSQHGRGYAPKGKTPVIRLNAKRESINLISAITNQGNIRFRVFDGTMNAGILIDFMQRLIKDAKRKVFLILDNLRVHHAKVVKAWLAEHKDGIDVFYLPSYSPELNPDEHMNCNLKAGVHGSTPARSKAELKAKAIAHLRKLQILPGRVMKYFQAEPIR